MDELNRLDKRKAGGSYKKRETSSATNWVTGRTNQKALEAHTCTQQGISDDSLRYMCPQFAHDK